ncbi:SET domain-containing protein [Thozetella sp. PMI_491]|nr:SET domain-containing protein [Thozetella sp. PMI_491]
MFQVQQAAGKGLGVFATQLIRRGTRILAERPLISIDKTSPNVVAAARRLSAPQRTQLLDLSLNQKRRSSILSLLEVAWYSLPRLGSIAANRDLLNAFRNNNFALGDDAGTQSCFAQVARINHSCVPNAQGNFNTTLESFTVHALHDIPAGDEITISYLGDQLAAPEVRQSLLKQSHDFLCGCPICDSASPRARESADRRAEFRRKLTEYAEGEAQDEGAMLETLIHAYEEEGLAGRELASIYLAAAKVAAERQQHESARRLGQRGLQLGEDAVGLDSPLYISDAALLSQQLGELPS